MSKLEGVKDKVFRPLGARNYAVGPRSENDYYATDPQAIDRLEAKYRLPDAVWEPCCGEGHLSKRMEELGHTVVSTDLIDREYGTGGVDFLKTEKMPDGCGCIATNPPFKIALPIILHAIELLPEGGVCAMFVRTLFLESDKRYKELFSKWPPQRVYQFVSRIKCAANGEFDKQGSAAMAFCWMIWEKGSKEKTVLEWI